MTKRIVTRGNTTFLTFVFYDENDELATVDSAEVQITYPGAGDFITETITLEVSGFEWSGEWDSSKALPGWAEYHAHALAATGDYAQDGRFRITANRANMDHDTLPRSGTSSSSSMGYTPGLDYGS